MTLDFVEDAADVLEKHEGGYILLAVTGDEKGCFCASANITNQAQLDWFRRRFEDYAAKIAAKFEGGE